MLCHYTTPFTTQLTAQAVANLPSDEHNIVGLAQVLSLLFQGTVAGAWYDSHMAAVIKGGGVNWSTGVTGAGVTERAIKPPVVQDSEDVEQGHLWSAIVALEHGVLGTARVGSHPQLHTLEDSKHGT